MSNKTGKEELKLKCVTLKGELSFMGKHILMPFGITVCGMPTVDADINQFAALKEPSMQDIISEYTIEEWDITCDKCLSVTQMLKEHKQRKEN